MVLKSKTHPSLLSFLLFLSIPLGCGKSHLEVPTRNGTDRVTQPWTPRLPNCEDPATPTPMGSVLGPELLGYCPPWVLLLADVLWFSLLSLALPAYGAFMSYPLLGCHFQASASQWQFISLDLRTVGLRSPFDTLPALFAFRPEVISRVPETASHLGSFRASPSLSCQFALALPGLGSVWVEKISKLTLNQAWAKPESPSFCIGQSLGGSRG